MNRNPGFFITSNWLFAAALFVCACAPVADPSKAPTQDAPQAITPDKGPIDQKETDKQNAQANTDSVCPKGLIDVRGPELPLLRLTEAELKDLEKQAPLNIEKYPLTTPGIGNNKAGLKHTPYSAKKQIAYKVDLRRYSPPTHSEALIGIKLIVPIIRKYSKQKREFMCILESHQCSGEMTGKVTRHLNPDWQKEYSDLSFSDSYFQQIGTWRSVSLSRGNLVYERKNFIAYLYEDKDKHFLNMDALAAGKLTLIFGTQTYFDPENAKLKILISYCRE